MINNTVLINRRAVFPAGLRSQMLSVLHRSHGSVKGMKARAKDAMFWPGMSTDIQQARDECETRLQIAPSQGPPRPSRSLCRITPSR